jgi:hypothetical protein
MLINEYNGTEQQLGPLQNSEAQMMNVDSQVGNASAELARRQGLLNQTQRDDAHMRKRIHRNENPIFLHYLVFNRPAKVERLKGELQQMIAVEQDLSTKIATDSAQLQNLQQQQQGAHAVVERKHQLELMLRNIFSQVVDAQPPTQALQQLFAGEQQERGLLALEQALDQAMGSSVHQVQQGLSLFQQAENLYRQAHSTNEEAKRVNNRERSELRRERRDEAVGNEFGAENAEWNAEVLERRERELQARRDSLINQAHDVALRAYQVISNAFATFPAEGRYRYPQLCASIGQVAYPCVRGANFSATLMTDAIFGTLGAAMNDMSSGCHIQDNMRVVEQCISMTSQQLGLLTAMQNAVRAAEQQHLANLRNLEQNIQAERGNIFNAVRTMVMSSAARAA